MVDEDMAKELNKEVVKKLCEDSFLINMMMVMVVEVIMKLCENSYLINMMMVMVVEVIMKLKAIMPAGQGGCKIL